MYYVHTMQIPSTSHWASIQLPGSSQLPAVTANKIDVNKIKLNILRNQKLIGKVFHMKYNNFLIVISKTVYLRR